MSELTASMNRYVADTRRWSAPEREPYDALHWTLAREVERLERELSEAHSSTLRVRADYDALKEQARARAWIGMTKVANYSPCEECGVKHGDWHLGACSKA